MTGAAKAEVVDQLEECLKELLANAGAELVRRGVRLEQIDTMVVPAQQTRTSCYLRVDGVSVYLATVSIDGTGVVVPRSSKGTWLVTGLRTVGMAQLDRLASEIEYDRAKRAAS